MAPSPCALLFVWHLHQPYYAMPGARVFEMPWVRLHAAKSYLDMATALGEHPKVRCVANFSGALLEQLDCYVSRGWTDRYQALTERPAADLSDQEVGFVLRYFFSLDHRTVVPRFPRYEALLERRNQLAGESGASGGAARFSTAELTDLQVLFNLAWCGFTLRENDERVRALMAKGRDFDARDKAAILAVHRDALAQIVPAWSELMGRGQVELSVTPHYHPIAPLLLDSDIARRALPDHPLPARFRFPQDVGEHIALAHREAERQFGVRPSGMWPAEGSVSPELLPVAGAHGVRWMASDEEVLLRSTCDGPVERRDIYQPWSSGASTPALFFRDRELSDLIGFSYSHIAEDKAADDFAARCRAIQAGARHAGPSVIPVILDGENAWEHYPDDGRPFLTRLYQRLSGLGDLPTKTASEVLADAPPRRQVRRLHSGSWIHANFRIWIGVEEKNRAWNQLARARQELETAPAGNKERALRYLLRAEGSDWMWWYGPDFSAAEKPIFDALFRANLRAAHRELDLPVPGALHESAEAVTVECEVKPPRNLIRPRIDGNLGGYYDWLGAGSIVPTGAGSSMFQGSRYVHAIQYGFDLEHLYLRMVLDELVGPAAGHRLGVRVGLDDHVVDMAIDEVGAVPTSPVGMALFGECLELELPLASLDLAPGTEVRIWFSVARDDIVLERVPTRGRLSIEVPDASFEGKHWLV